MKILLYLMIGIIIGIIIANISNKNNNRGDTLDKNETINTLIRQMSRWSNAAIQDKSPIVSVLHANYGTGYLWSLKDIVTDDDIQKATGLNSKKLTKKITDIQDKTTLNLFKVCPQYANYLDKQLLLIGK